LSPRFPLASEGAPLAAPGNNRALTEESTLMLEI
jgi:hypothetical protein